MDDLFNLDQIEALARKRCPKNECAYFSSAGDDLITKKLHIVVYKSILLRPRTYIDCDKCSTSTTLLGNRVGTSLYVFPTAMARLAHPAGEWDFAQGI